MLIKRVKNELMGFYNHRVILLELAKKDFRIKFLGTYLGFFWAFFQPLVFLSVLWFVVTIGFRSAPQGGEVPYFLWLSAGILPWYYMSESIQVGSGTILEYSYLIKKMRIRSEIIPLIKVFSLLSIHLFFVFVLGSIAIVNGYFPTWSWLQLPYYLVGMVFFLSGINFFTSSVAVFVKDAQLVVSVLLQLFFWGTPILWSLDQVPRGIRYIFELNPLFYIVNGYRDAIIYRKWFWETPLLAIYFWGVSLAIFVIGFLVFKKLKPHFGDVL